MNENDFISIADFAETQGISKQRVYQLLNTKFKGVVQEFQGRKMLKISALQEMGFKGLETNFKEFVQGVEQDFQGGENDLKKDEHNKTLDLLQQTIEMLQKQLDEKDKQINELTEALKNEQIQTSQAQALHSGSIQQLLSAPAKKKSIFSKLFKKQN